MDNFIKYYSYNQLIENFDILVMTEQEYLQNKDQLDNPQMIVLVNREGGPKPPKIPLWFKSYKTEVDKQFELINQKFEAIDKKFEAIDKKFEAIDKKFEAIDKKFEAIDKKFETIDRRFDYMDNHAPKWFVEFMTQFAKKNNLKF